MHYTVRWQAGDDTYLVTAFVADGEVVETVSIRDHKTDVSLDVEQVFDKHEEHIGDLADIVLREHRRATSARPGT